MELKRCPFCGGKAELCGKLQGESYKEEAPFAVNCTECYGGTAIDWDTKTEAIKAWNTRWDGK